MTIAQYQRKADAMISKVQKRINTKGAFENAGQKEINEFMDVVRADNTLHYQDQCKLNNYINQLVDNLQY